MGEERDSFLIYPGVGDAIYENCFFGGCFFVLVKYILLPGAWSSFEHVSINYDIINVRVVMLMGMLMHAAVVAHLIGLGIVADNLATGVDRGPDDAIIIFGHAHRRPGWPLVHGGELALLRVKLDEMAAEVAVVAAVARQD